MAESVSSLNGKFSNFEITSGVKATGKILGTGSDATVHEVDYRGTLCAAKEVHTILLRDQSPGGAECFIANFLKECNTWFTLSHPRIVQVLGLHWKNGSLVPMLILEKMDTSLRNYLEAHKKEEFSLPDKVYVLRQVAQALSYLHSLSPPLVHHDLSTNNVLLNDVSLQTKVTDFGMTRALDPSKTTRKSSVKGTQAFMAPEALVEPPKYDDKLDVFSYGNVIVTTVTHQWPNPGPYNKYKGGKLVGVSELQRRQQYIDQFSQEERALLLPTVRSCLENRPSQRPTSIQVVDRMRQIEASHPQEGQSRKSAMVHLWEQLHEKESELHICKTQLQENDTKIQQKEAQLQQRDQLLRLQHEEIESKDTQLQQYQTQLQEKDDQLKQIDDQLKQKDVQLKQNDAQLKQNDEDSGREYALLLHENQQIQQERDQLKCELDQLNHEHNQPIYRHERDQSRCKQDQNSPCHQELTSNPTQPLSAQSLHHKIPTEILSASTQVAKKPPRNWRDMKCQKILKCGGGCLSVATNADLIAVGVWDFVDYRVEVYDKRNSELSCVIGRGQLGGVLYGVAFLDEETIVVSDYNKGNIKLFTLKGKLLRTIDRGRTTFKPLGVTVSPNGLIYVCDGANDCVCVFMVRGQSLLSIGSRGTGDECFDWPRDLCFASDGLLYITDANNSRICVYDKDGKFIRKFPTTCKPTCIDATDCGRLIVSSWSSHKVMIYTTGGCFVHMFGERGCRFGQFCGLYGVFVDGDRLIYIADYDNHRIQIF